MASIHSAWGRRRLLIVLLVLAVLGVVLALYFEPHKLFLDQEVTEGLPPAERSDGAGEAQSGGGSSASADVRTLSRGAFRSLAHAAEGDARVIELGDGRRFLRLEHLRVENGPDLRVYLSAAPASSSDDAFDDDFVELGELKGNVGDQNYEIPDGARLARLHSAVIWCRRFSVGFAVAPLE